jgi:ankyrin repeat protein
MPDSAAFIDAIKAGEFDRVKTMVSADPELINARGRTGDSAILTAVYHRQKEIVNLLVSRGASMTIFEACAAGEFDRVERMLDGGAVAINTFSRDGWTPLHLAAFFGHVKLAELLLSRGADAGARSQNSNGNTPLHAALAGNHSFVAGLLLGAGADVNAIDAAGWRPLHIAASNNNLDAMRTLIAQGADVEATNADGKTPLSLVQEKNQREAAALLRRHGA